jgi:hypothetical protein
VSNQLAIAALATTPTQTAEAQTNVKNESERKATRKSHLLLDAAEQWQCNS